MNYSNTTARSTNAAHVHPVITIRVVSVTGRAVWYRNYHQGEAGKVFKFVATTSKDFKTLATLEPGKAYQVCQEVDHVNFTHWTAAMPFSGGKVFKPAAIIQRVEVKRKVKENLSADLIVF